VSGVAPSTPPELLGSRDSRLLGRWRRRPSAVLVAAFSTLVVFGLLAFVIVNAPGWPRVQQSFFSADKFFESIPDLVGALWINVQIFAVAETLILTFSLVLAVMRSLPGPVFFPLRLIAVIYIDVFRAVPSVLVIFLIGFGIPGLRLKGVTNDAFVWGLVALVLVWSAYVAEVYRAGIEAVHPSQDAAARSLGLSRFQALRFVVLPQAIRRVIPPLLNDFIGLQKDTALVSFVGVVEVFRQMQLDAGGSFNFTPYLAGAAIFLVLTIPVARFVDWLVSRDRKRQLATIAR
jgi:polar amino acid transport system permease protein